MNKKNELPKNILKQKLRRALKNDYYWIARDGYWDINGIYKPEHGRLAVHKIKPYKHKQDYWFEAEFYQSYAIQDFGLLFPLISWENDEPTRIEDVLSSL